MHRQLTQCQHHFWPKGEFVTSGSRQNMKFACLPTAGAGESRLISSIDKVQEWSPHVNELCFRALPSAGIQFLGSCRSCRSEERAPEIIAMGY